VPLTVVIPGAFLAIVILAAVFAPLVAPYGPTTGSISQRLLAVGSPGHLLGTDGQGRDILSRLIWGARPSLLEGIVPVVVAGIIGTVLGVVASLSGRKIHTLIMRTLDVLYSFPAVLLAIALAAALGAGVVNAIVALTIVLIAPIARVAETEVARMRSADFMEAARASGASWPRIARRQVLPIIAPVLLVYCTALIGLAIVFAGGLSFLGLGIAPPHPEWGSMLNDLVQDLYNQPVLALIPAAMIFVTSVAFNVLGDGLRDLLDIHSETVS
jgi:peptide/nickel transport system permease protein